MRRLLMGTLLFSLWLWAFTQEIENTTAQGNDQHVIKSHSSELDA
ncbi:MAG: hypothetical protein ABXS91_01310 [Sulfurimonas sp.]